MAGLSPLLFFSAALAWLAKSRPFFQLAVVALGATQQLRQPGQTPRARREVDDDEPGADQIGQVVQPVGEGDAVQGGVDGEEEE